MIDPDKLEAMAQVIYERENQFNTYTLEKIAKRVKATGELSAYDQESLKNIADITGDMDAITKELARITKLNIADVEKIYAKTINDGINSYEPLYDFKKIKFKNYKDNEYALKLVRQWAEMTAEKMINLSNAKIIGFTDDKGNFTTIAGTYQQVIDDAIVAVSNGTVDFNSAMEETIKRLGGSGVVTNYGNKITRPIESAIRSNILYGAKKAAESYDNYVSEELGLDGFEVDAHSGCRPSHVFMQGKMYSYGGKKTIKGVTYEDGTDALAALEDYGCLHFKTGVLLGVSEPRYSPEELEQIYKETTELIEYNGKKKTLYEWKQTQRRLEREYRKTKTQSDTFKAAGNNAKAREYKEAAKAIKDNYDTMTKAVPGLYKHHERMRTYFKGNKTLESGGNGSIIDDAKTKVLRGNAIVANRTEGIDVQLVGKIDKNVYKCVTDEIITDEVIITEERIQHIIDGHPDDYERFCSYIPTIISSPDYIIEANKENTAVILKEIEENGEKFKLILRMAVKTDPSNYKNSIISFWHIGEKTWKKTLKNKKILYKSK